MNGNKNIIYTESAKQRLEKFHLEINEEVERYFQERKFVPGDEFIEVTASDIDEIAQRFKISRPIRTNPIKTLIPIVYTIVGLLLTGLGLFYEQFKSILEGDPKRLVFIGSGIFMIGLSWAYVYIIKSSERREQLERHFKEMERRRNNININEN